MIFLLYSWILLLSNIKLLIVILYQDVERRIYEYQNNISVNVHPDFLGSNQTF